MKMNEYERQPIKYKRKIITMLVVTALLIGIALFGKNHFSQRQDVPNLDGHYFHMYRGYYYNRSYYEFIPDEDNPRYGIYYMISEEKEKNSDRQFAYEIKDGKVIMDMSAYTVFENYLIPEEYTWSGYVTNEKTFDAVCEYKNVEYEYGDKLIFNSDGTVERNFYNEGETSIDSGTYTRKGDVITCTFDGEDFHYLVYKNQINDSILYKSDAATIK